MVFYLENTIESLTILSTLCIEIRQNCVFVITFFFNRLPVNSGTTYSSTDSLTQLIFLQKMCETSVKIIQNCDVGMLYAKGNKKFLILSRILAQSCITPPYIFRQRDYA